MKKFSTTLSLCFLFANTLFAADPPVAKYAPPAPALAGKAGVITLNAPVTTARNPDNTVLVTSAGTYNYDKANYYFGGITVKVTFTEPGQAAVDAASAVITDESTLPAGIWAAASLIPINLANGTTYTVQATLTLYTKVRDPVNPAKFIKGPPVNFKSGAETGTITAQSIE